jgi:hypothetical protein
MKVVVAADTVEFLKSLTGFLATRDGANRPTACESILLALDPETGVGEIAANARFARQMTANLRDNGRFALVVSRAWADHRSAQIKGRCLSVDGPVRDPRRVRPAIEALAVVLESFNLPARVPRDFRAQEIDPWYLVRVQVDEVFEQTPGPGAGRRLA